MSKRFLQQKYPEASIKRLFFNDYNYILSLNEKTYYIKVLNVNKNAILSINSKHFWQIKRGKAVGISFKVNSEMLIDMRPFNNLPNKIVVFKTKPYKILKVVNESEVIDISSADKIFDIKIYNSIKEMIV